MPKKYIVGRRVGGSIKRLSSHSEKSTACYKMLELHYDRGEVDLAVYRIAGDGLHARRVSCDSQRGKRRRGA